MRLLAIGGDLRMQGAVKAAEQAGWEGKWNEDGRLDANYAADVIMLPWPHSFRHEHLIVRPGVEGAPKDSVLRALAPCSLCVMGSGVSGEEIAQAADVLLPQTDELFLRRNAQLTAEGAILRAMQRMDRALLGCTCLITGYGRIGQELTARLIAMGAFVIVCARSEMQMRSAHAAGAHPVPLGQVAHAAASADLIFGTVPAQVLGGEALGALRSDALIIELASPPYGVDMEKARALGVNLLVEAGVPGRYAPMQAGEALFEAARRHLARKEEAHG